MSDVKIVVKVRAYERGILPTKISQLQNDAGYATMEWVKKYVKDHCSGGGGTVVEIQVNGGLVTDTGAIKNIVNAGEVGQSGPVTRYDFGVIGG